MLEARPEALHCISALARVGASRGAALISGQRRRPALWRPAPAAPRHHSSVQQPHPCHPSFSQRQLSPLWRSAFAEVPLGEDVQQADALTVSLLGGTLMAGVVTAWALLGEEKMVVKSNVKPEELNYVCEGASGVLCAYTGKARDWQGRLLHLPKQVADSSTPAELLRAKLQHELASHCFETRFVDQPQVVLLPTATVRAIDAQLLAARSPQNRNVKLALQESPEHPGFVPGLRINDLLKAPPPQGKGASPSPVITVELPMGVGLQEVTGLPSRYALAWHLAQEKPSGAPRYDPAVLFSGKSDQLKEVVQASILPPTHGGSCRIFVDGSPVHPASLPSSEGWASARRTVSSGDVLAGRLEGCCFSGTEELVKALVAVLSSSQTGHGFLADLQRLQCYAGGECEKMAERLLGDLRTSGGEEAVALLSQEEHILATIASASHGRTGKDGVQAHEREGRRLLATSSRRPQEIAAMQRWLQLFLLGRAAMEARVTLNFFSPGPGTRTPAEQRFLQSWRYMPLAEILPNQPWCADIWFCVTLSSMCPKPVSEVAVCKTELEELVKRYREIAAPPAK